MGKYTKWIYLEKPNTKYLNMPLTFLQITQENNHTRGNYAREFWIIKQSKQ